MNKNIILKGVLMASLVSSSVFTGNIHIFAEDITPTNENLALNKTVKADNEYSTMPASYLTDADENSRWSAEKAPTQSAYVDLGKSYEMNYFAMIWEKAGEHAQDYNIYVSDDTNAWGTPVVERKNNDSDKSQDVLKDKVRGRYVKLEITKQKGYQNVSCRDFKVMLKDGDLPQNPDENIALKKTTVASSIEADSVKASNAFDGDTTSKTSRWGSNLGSGPHWIYVDLGKKQDIQTIRIFWETRKATKYRIQVADTLSSPTKDADWTDVKVKEQRPSSKTENIILDEPIQHRYVRLYIDTITDEDPDGGVKWNSISIYEMEVYGGVSSSETIDDFADKITVNTPAKGDKKLVVNLPTSEMYSAEYNGSDYEQIVDSDLTIYEPIVDSTVTSSFKIKNKVNDKYIFKEIKVSVPGTYQVQEADNKAPVILPELREWKGFEGTFTPIASSRIVVGDSRLQEMAEAFKKDYKDITGNDIAVVSGTSASDHDYFFTLTTDTSLGLMDEGYIMEVNDSVKVKAQTTTGAFWATRTILQSLKQTGDIPNGITRDYPLYKVRGFILDVGRKTFTLDNLNDIMKEMSWYKLNDFQVHLNDNYIFLENYSNSGRDPMSAYSGFRLESDIKEGGNGGLNKADLTSKDVFYTKDEFRDFIKKSRVYGVNIVPEIDTPAHSLALTKVRPDLRQGSDGRQNDHLNLSTKYDESLSFVKSIFDEYMGEGLHNPVFDEQTTIHVGADEYTADGNAFRRFSNDMLSYVKDSGRTSRIWGSLTQIQGDVQVQSDGVQMNLWNYGWANMDQMYDEGFDLINCNDGNYYVVPNAGYYYDYLNSDTMYNLDINTIGGVTIPSGDKQMIGGAFAVWNDMVDEKDTGVSEYDVYDRIKDALPLFGAKLWGKGEMTLEEAKQTSSNTGSAPSTNFTYDVDSKSDAIAHYPMDDTSDTSSNGRDLHNAKNATIVNVDGKKALELKGGKSFVNTNIETAGLGNDLRVKVKRTSDSKDEQILFESSYGTIKAVQKKTGNVGISRENYDYSFNYELPINEWVELEIKNEQNVTKLYVNGNLMDVIGDGEMVQGRPLLATSMLPFAKIGSESNAFIGYIDDVRLGKNDEFNSTMALDYVVSNANTILKQNAKSKSVITKKEALTSLVNQANEVITKYAPSAQEINDLTKEIEDVLASMVYAKANYTRLDTYVNLIPKDMTYFTSESMSQLKTAIDMIRRDLPKASQSLVDNYEANIVKALGQLKLKKIENINFVDNSKLTASASSYQDESANPNKAIDGKTDTMWHSKWSVTTMPHWIDLEIDELTEVNGLTYVPRSGGGNGTASKYRIDVSSDGIAYNTVKEGTLAVNETPKEIQFDTVNTKHVRMYFIEAKNNNGSAAEIKLHAANVAADTEGLNAIIMNAEAITNNGFTTSTWDALQSKISEAKALTSLKAIDANVVEVMKRELLTGMISLRLNPKQGEEVGYAKLEDLYNLLSDSIQKGDVNEEAYTQDSWSTFINAMETAKDVIQNVNATQEEVDGAEHKLAQAFNGLVIITTPEEVDFSKLQALVNVVSSLVENEYTEQSWKAFAQALQQANSILGKQNATQEEVNQAVNTLTKAYVELIKKPIPPVDSENPSNPTNPETPKSPDTGDIVYASSWMILLLMSGGFIVVKAMKKREE